MDRAYLNILNEITPLSQGDCLYIADRKKTTFTYPVHSHADYELNFIFNGEGLTRRVGDSFETIENMELVLIANPNLDHAWEQGECASEVREITIQFSSDLFFGSLLNTNQCDPIRKMMERAKNGLVFSRMTMMKVYSILDELSTEKSGFCAMIKFLSMLYELSIDTDSRVLASSSYTKIDLTSHSRRIQKVMTYIQNNYKDVINISTMSELINMSEVGFCRFFKTHTAKSFSDYLIDYRLGVVTRLMLDSNMSIAEICYECGFNNVSNFNRIFKKKKGCTPKWFRIEKRKTRKLI